jgi:DNA-binding NarL/FixJ family response regulator
MKRVLNILIVEDKNIDHLRILDLLGSISDQEKIFHGIKDFECTRVESAKDAEALLSKAAENQKPFDIMILDLELPEYNNASSRADMEKDRGLGLIKMARDSVRDIVIFTIFDEYNYLQSALRQGVVNYVDKKHKEELPLRVLSCWQGILKKDSTSLFEDRVKSLIPYTEKGLARRFSAYFIEFAQLVTITSEDILRYVKERFGLDQKKDPEDFMVRLLKKQADKSTEMENKLKSDLSPGEADENKEPLYLLMEKIHQELLPCLLVKRVDLNFDFPESEDLSIRTFQNDARAVLQEVILGALSAQPDYPAYSNENLYINITAQTKGDQIEIGITDNLTPIPSEDAQKINAGFNYSSDPSNKFSQTWGLSVVQQVALLNGGRLHVKPQTAGNVITYFAPRAQ